MPRLPAALALALLAPPLSAQQWQAGDRLDVVRRAVAARAGRDADTGLAGWQATASGVVRFAAVIDHGNGPIERVIRADELRLEVYGEAPNRSKQVIRAWRDTTLQPTGIVYHRDHLGIVAHDFGPTIRLGEGEEVRDVPHPLSAIGLDWYEFRVGDTLTVGGSGGAVRVLAVDVRPARTDAAGVVGTLLLDTDRAALVRAQFTFTAAAYRDPSVARIVVRLENALHEGVRWLPWRQAVAIHRASPLLALPLETVIRADWTIADYQLGVHHPAERFRGAAIDGLRAPDDSGEWSLPWSARLDELPASEAELAAVTDAAASLVRSNLLDGLPTLRLLADGGVSRWLHVNRVQGVALGAGLSLDAPLATTLVLGAGVGTADGRVTGRGAVHGSLANLRIAVEASREIRDLHEVSRRSGVANSLHTLLRGDDAGDWYLDESIGATLEHRSGPWRRGLSLRRERIASVANAFEGLGGSMRPNPPLGVGVITVAAASVGWHRDDGKGGRVAVEHGSGDTAAWWRAAVEANGALPGGVTWRADGGVATRNLPPHRGFVAGGAGSLPGTVPGAIGGRRLLRVEIARPVAIRPPSPLIGRRWNATLTSRLVPFVAAGVAGGAIEGLPWRADGRVEPVVGMRLDLWGPLLRIEAGWAPREGGFSLSVDAHPDWWPVL